MATSSATSSPSLASVPSPTFSSTSTAVSSTPSYPWFRRRPPPVTFGSEADLQTATHDISLKLIQTIRKARKDSAIVVLNFRALQARRIDEMQEELLKLSNRKLEMKMESQTDSESEDDNGLPRPQYEKARELNLHIDTLLHRYGTHLLFA